MADDPSLAMQSGLAAPQGMPPPPMNPPNFSGSPMLQQSATPPAQQQPQQSVFMGQDQRAQAESYAILDKAQKDRAAWKEFQSKEAPIMDSLAKELRIGPPRYPEQQRLEKPPNPDDFKKYSVEFASAFALLGALAGKFTRAGGTAALDAFAGAVRGYEQGNLQAYKQKSDEWEQKTQQTLLNNKMVLDKWKAVVENRRMSLADKELSLKMLSVQYQQQIEYDALEAGNFGLAMKSYDMNVAAHDKAVEAFLAVRGNKVHADDEMRGKAQFLESPQGQQFIQSQPPEQQMILQGVIKTYGTGGTAEQGGGNLGPLVREVGQYRMPIQTAMARLPAEDRQKFAQLLEQQFPEFKASYYQAEQAGMTAENRTVGGRLGIIDMNLNAMDALIPAALQASDSVPRGNWVPLNKLIQAGQVSTSDPKLKDFAIKNLNLAELWAKGMNPGGVMRVDDRDIALRMLSTADGPEAYRTAVKDLKDFLVREKAAAQRTRSETLGRGAAPQQQSPQSGTAATPQPGDIQEGYRFKGGNPADKSSWEPAT